MTTFLRRLFHAFTSTPPVDLIDPPPAKVRQDCDGFPLRTTAVGQIMAAHSAEVVNLAERRKQLDSIVSYRRTH